VCTDLRAPHDGVGLLEELLHRLWVLADGHIGLSDRPGLGIDIREEAVAQMPYDEAMAFRQYRHSDGNWSDW
jgi:L-alanine-DL-glutamate epimerase-like enolase superfamily enzyme